MDKIPMNTINMVREISNKYREDSLRVVVFSIKGRMIPMLYINKEFLPFSVEEHNFVKQYGFDEEETLAEVYLFETSAINEAFWNGAPDVVNHGVLIWMSEKRRKMMSEELFNKKTQLSRLREEIRRLEKYLSK